MLAKIQNISPKRLSIAEAIHIYKNDLVGILQVNNEDEKSLEETLPEDEMWTGIVGHVWRLPSDGRLPLRFQKRWLLSQSAMRVRSDPLPAEVYLRKLADEWSSIPVAEFYRLPFQPASSNIHITDYFDHDMGIEYDFEPSPAEPLEEPDFMEKSELRSSRAALMCSSGPWRRIM